jgi:hypothetical protein
MIRAEGFGGRHFNAPTAQRDPGHPVAAEID